MDISEGGITLDAKCASKVSHKRTFSYQVTDPGDSEFGKIGETLKFSRKTGGGEPPRVSPIEKYTHPITPLVAALMGMGLTQTEAIAVDRRCWMLAAADVPEAKATAIAARLGREVAAIAGSR